MQERLFCPACGQKGRAVKRITIASLLKPEHRFRIPEGETFGFCSTQSCSTVYYGNGKALFNKGNLSVRVGLKETEDSIPLCYCFGFTRSSIEEEIREKGKTDIPDRIKEELKKENCYCEITNPQGVCCLGNIAKAAEEINEKLRRK